MFSLIKKSVLVSGFVVASFVSVQALDSVKGEPAKYSVSDCKGALQAIAQDLVAKNNISDPKIVSLSQNASTLKEEDLITLCDQLLVYEKELGDDFTTVMAIQDELIKYLRGFVAIKTPDISPDFNLALIYNVQNPNFTVTFVNPEGKVKTRKYALKIRSIGLKAEIAIKISGIMIGGSDFNYYDSANKEYIDKIF